MTKSRNQIPHWNLFQPAASPCVSSVQHLSFHCIIRCLFWCFLYLDLHSFLCCFHRYCRVLLPVVLFPFSVFCKYPSSGGTMKSPLVRADKRRYWIKPKNPNNQNKVTILSQRTCTVHNMCYQPRYKYSPVPEYGGMSTLYKKWRNQLELGRWSSPTIK